MKKNNVVFSSTRIKSEQDFSIRILFELEKSRRIQALLKIEHKWMERKGIEWNVMIKIELNGMK